LKTYQSTDSAVIIQQVVFAALLDRGFQFSPNQNEALAFQKSSSGAFSEVAMYYAHSNRNSYVVVRSMQIGNSLHVYGRCIKIKKNTSKTDKTDKTDKTERTLVTHQIKVPLSTAQSMMQEQQSSEHPLFAHVSVHLAYRLVPSCMPVADFHSLTITRGVWIAAMQYVSVADIGALASTCLSFQTALNSNESLWKLLLKRDTIIQTSIKKVPGVVKSKSSSTLAVYKSQVQERVHAQKLKDQELQRREQMREQMRRDRERQMMYPPRHPTFPGGHFGGGGRGGRGGQGGGLYGGNPLFGGGRGPPPPPFLGDPMPGYGGVGRGGGSTTGTNVGGFRFL